MLNTLEKAIEWVKREHPSAHFLTKEELQSPENAFTNVVCLIRGSHRFYTPTLATFVQLLPGGRAQVYLYATGTQTGTVDPRAIYREPASRWAQGLPLFGHCHHGEYMAGEVYWKRKKYTRKYPYSLDSEEVERLVAQNWEQDPGLFTCTWK